jgi:hypothetical protein
MGPKPKCFDYWQKGYRIPQLKTGPEIKIKERSMTGKELIPIIVALIGLFGAVITFILQKNKELNLKLAEQKRVAYTVFLDNFTEIVVKITHGQKTSGKVTDRNRIRARDQLLLYGSDEAVKAYDAWIRYADNEDHDLEKEGELLSLMLLAIRKDILGKTEVSLREMENLNSFIRG